MDCVHHNLFNPLFAPAFAGAFPGAFVADAVVVAGFNALPS